MLTGLITNDTGDIFIDSYNLKNSFEEAISNVSAIVEIPFLYEYMSGRDNIDIFSKLYKVSNTSINKALKISDLGNRLSNKVKVYSLGMKQRLGILLTIMIMSILAFAEYNDVQTSNRTSTSINWREREEFLLFQSESILNDPFYDEVQKEQILKRLEIAKYRLDNVASSNVLYGVNGPYVIGIATYSIIIVLLKLIEIIFTVSLVFMISMLLKSISPSALTSILTTFIVSPIMLYAGMIVLIYVLL